MQENGVVHSAGWCIVVLRCCGRMRSGARQWRISSRKLYIAWGGQGLARAEERGHPACRELQSIAIFYIG